MKQGPGSRLKKARKERGITIAQASDQTRIRQSYLEALEEDEYELFSSETHIKGFLKTYSSYLGLSPEQQVALYRRDGKAPPKATNTASILKRRGGDFTKGVQLSRRHSLILASTLLVLLLVYYIASQVSAVFKSPLLEITSPVFVTADYTGDMQWQETSIQFLGTTESQTVVRLNGEVLRLSPDLKFSSPILPLSTNETSFLFTATNQLGRESSIRLRVLRNAVETSL